MIDLLLIAAVVALIGMVGFLAIQRRGDGHEGDYVRRARWARGAISSVEKKGRTVKALRIENVGVGGLFQIRGFGPNFEDVDLHVQARHVYDEEGWIWAELECDSKIGTVFVTVEVDDTVEVSATTKKLTLEEAGLTPRTLNTIWEDETGSATVDGARFGLDELGDADFFPRGDEDRAQRFRYWQFKGPSDRILSVERWGRGEFDVHLSIPIRDSQISVFSLNGAD